MKNYRPAPTAEDLRATLRHNGVESALLDNAAETAARLSRQVPSSEGTALNPDGPADYQRLMQRLADEASS